MELGFLISPRKDNTAIAVLLPLEQALLWSLRNDPAEDFGIAHRQCLALHDLAQPAKLDAMQGSGSAQGESWIAE